VARSCSICARADRDAIEHAVVSGGSIRAIAGQYGVTKSSLSRHVGSHLPATTIVEVQEADRDRAAGLRERLEDLYTRAERILQQAEDTGRHNVSLASIRELRGILEFASRLAGLPQAQEPIIELKFHDGRAIPDYRHNLRALPSEEL
jgi:transposase-like protein